MESGEDGVQNLPTELIKLSQYSLSSLAADTLIEVAGQFIIELFEKARYFIWFYRQYSLS